MSRTPSVFSEDDPISVALRPPVAESDLDRRSRLRREEQAKLISEQIDEELRLDRERLKKSKNDVKLLVLGQAESGKSTLQKQFQLMYKPNSLENERSSWRTVVFFNVVRSLNHILTTLETWGDTFDDPDADRHLPSNNIDNSPSTPEGGTPRSSLSQAERHSISRSLPLVASETLGPSLHLGQNSGVEALKYQIATLRRRLSPLVAADAQLAERLTDGVTVSGSGKGSVFVRSGWQARSIENGLSVKRPRLNYNLEMKAANDNSTAKEDVLVDDVGKMLSASKQDIQELWLHPTVRALIAKRKLKLDEWEEFFLNDISRIASLSYWPTTDDILHARIQTMGVAEHVFDVDLYGKEVTWHLFDVGGARGQRHTWIPFFDDANAIIFLAPISAFDQVREILDTYIIDIPCKYLQEDPRTNRIDDSLQLFTQICSSALLKSVHLVLFLNKTDLLKQKLAAGVKVNKYITSFGERPNDFDSVVHYFRTHFMQAHKRNNQNRRGLYSHLTSVVDTKTTHSIIANVRDSIFRDYLQSAALV